MREDTSPNTEYIVPLDLVAETVEGTIQLRCSKAELQKLDPFVQTEVIAEKASDMYIGSTGTYAGYGMGSYYYWPYVMRGGTVYVPVDHLQIPPGELAVRRGLRVEATDGYVGRVDEFVVNPQNSHITHLVMREGHLWGHKDVIIPLAALDRTREDTVFLKLAKREIESLPTFPVHRRWA